MVWPFGRSDSNTQEVAVQDEKTVQQNLGFDPTQLTNFLSVDTAKLHPLAGLDKEIEFLDLEDEQLASMEGSQGLIPSRGWTDDLCYGTGAVYLLGLGIGGLQGFSSGVQNLPQGEKVANKLKINTILNHITKRGPFMGNSAGVLALSYNLINSSIDGLRGKHDSLNSIASGALAGALFKSSKGLRPMGIASGLMGLTAAAWCGLKAVLS